MQKVPSKDTTLQNMMLLDELTEALHGVVSADSATLGRHLEVFEREFAQWLGLPHASGVNSGTDALVLALEALDVRAGDEVVVPSHTYGATVLAVLRVGARPVLVEPDPASYVVSGESMASAVTSATRVLLPVHMYGLPCEMGEILQTAERRGLHVLEDAAQAQGATWNGTRAGTWGRMACFSFHPSKNLGTLGDSGVIVTHDESLDRRVKCLRDFGKEGKYRWVELGYNTKMDTLQAAFLSVKLRRLEAWNRRREEIAHRYSRELAHLDIGLPEIPEDGRRSCWHLYVVRVSGGRRDAVKDAMASRGVKCGIHYAIPPHLQPAFAEARWRPGQFPVAERLADEVLTLPLFSEMTDGQVDRVIECMDEVSGEQI